MKKVFLTSINRCKYPYPVYPLGMSHIAAALKASNYDVKLFDVGIQGDLLESAITEYKPDFVGISMRNIDDIRIDNITYFIPELSGIMTRVRRSTNAPVILGGSAFSLFPSQLLELAQADYGIVSEGEASIVELLSILSSVANPLQSQLSAIGGLVYKVDGTVKINPARQLDPTLIPLAFRDVAIESYYRENSGIVNIQTQRGCPCRCCYCSYPIIEGNRPRYRSAEHLVNEFIDAKKQGNQYFYVVDSVFNTSKDHVISICEEIIRKKVDINWGCFLKPSNLTEEMMVLMARAGLKHIEFGSDSFCDTVLEQYGKDFTFDDIYRASEWARKNKVHYAHFLITGGPGETEVTLQESFNNSCRLKKTAVFPFTGMRIFPGTALFKRALKENIIDESNDCLEPRFYISPLIQKERIFELLAEFQKKMPNWIINDLSPELVVVMNGFRKKGIMGPLWEFLAR